MAEHHAHQHQHHHHHKGNAQVGRAIVAGAVVLLVAANVYLCHACTPRGTPFINPENVKILLAMLWIATGAGAMCCRQMWGRLLVLAIVLLEALEFVVTDIILLSDSSLGLAPAFGAFVVCTIVYICVALMLCYSRHVGRLTSRSWE